MALADNSISRAISYIDVGLAVPCGICILKGGQEKGGDTRASVACKALELLLDEQEHELDDNGRSSVDVDFRLTSLVQAVKPN